MTTQTRIGTTVPAEPEDDETTAGGSNSQRITAHSVPNEKGVDFGLPGRTRAGSRILEAVPWASRSVNREPTLHGHQIPYQWTSGWIQHKANGAGRAEVTAASRAGGDHGGQRLGSGWQGRYQRISREQGKQQLAVEVSRE
jgi:hypothetical protein